MKKYAELRAEIGRINLVEASPLAHPLSLWLDPSNICNLRCTHCVQSYPNYLQGTGGHAILTLQKFERVAEQIQDLGKLNCLNLYHLGEPLVNKELPEMIKLARRMHIADRIIVTTNATLLDEMMAYRLIDSGLDYLRVSIYGTTQEEMQRTTQSRIKLDRVLANVKRMYDLRNLLKLERPHIHLKSLERGDAGYNARFTALAEGRADEVIFDGRMNWVDSVEGNLSGMDREQMLGTPLFKYRKEVCPAPFYTLTINANLSVSICCADWKKETTVGDLNLETLTEVWHGEALRQFRLAHIRRARASLPGCADCTFLHTYPDNVDAMQEEKFLAAPDREQKNSNNALDLYSLRE